MVPATPLDEEPPHGAPSGPAADSGRAGPGPGPGPAGPAGLTWWLVDCWLRMPALRLGRLSGFDRGSWERLVLLDLALAPAQVLI